MDYVQEELARQRLALAVLMLGGRTQGGTEVAGAEEGFPLSLAEQERTARKERKTAPAAEAFCGAQTGWWEVPPETAARLPAGGATGSGGVSGRWSGDETQAEAGRTGAAGTGDPAERRTAGESVPVDGGGRERTVTEVLWTDAGGASGARELSRTFQRDARRYDGGFSLY